MVLRSCRCEAGEDAGLGEKKAGGRDGEESAFAGWVGDLVGAESFDEVHGSKGRWFGGLGDVLEGAWTAGDNEDIKFADA